MQLVEATRDAQQAAEGDARLVADVRMVHLRCGGGISVYAVEALYLVNNP